MADGGDGGALRYSVISGPTGRRQWPDEVKARIVAESFVPGVRVGDVARRHGVLPSQLTTWRRMAKDGHLALPWESVGLSEPDFVPLIVEEDAAPAEAAAVPSVTGSRMEMPIEVVVGAVVVRLPAEVPVARLSALVRALAEASPR
ncbi:IS66-like element accessory protein TnpA [Cereibacter sediminicola]|uniref:IS66-like element accessory protein TnpA n=1 Tax=Cereibacter sediminicola TaxID=2584941 RepID=UPI0011A76310|nr:transposase [Cereibacter sediminicola]